MGIMSLTEIMDRSIEILKKYIKTIVTFNLAYGIISFCIIIVAIILGSIITAITMGLKLNGVLSTLIIGIVFSIFGLGITAYIISIKIGLIKISSQDFLSERIYASQAIGASAKKFFNVLGVLIMEILLFLPVVAVFAIIGYLIYNSAQQSMLFLGMYDKSEISLIILTGVVSLLGVLSILAYITIFTFSFHALAIENKGVFAALKRSYTLVKGDYFKILGCTILFGLTIYAITVSLQSFMGILASIIYMVLKFFNVSENFSTYLTMAYSFLQWPLSILSWLVISPLEIIMITNLYYNQRFKKEGYDILLKLNKIQKDEEKEQLSEGTQYDNSI